MDGIKLLSVLTLFSNVFTVLTAALFLLYKLGIYKKFWIRERIYIVENASIIILLVSSVATLGSLYFSEVRGFAPCKLCWYQRIFMYPQVLLIAAALYKKTKDVFKYIFILSVTGLLIAIYHYNLQINPNPYAPCGDIGFSVSCNENFFTYFGYITIPWMSLSAFLINFLVSFLQMKIHRTK